MGVAGGRRRSSHGFTLIEVVIVLVLAGMALALAVPFLGSGFGTLRSEAAGRKLVAFLNDARSRAVNTRSDVLVVYDFEERSFRQLLLPGREEKARYDLPNGVRMERTEEGGETEETGTASIVFHPLGDSGGGSLYMKGAGGWDYRITVGALLAIPRLEKVRATD